MNAVELAQARASISAYLSNNPGRHLAMDVAKAVGMVPKSAGMLMAGMAKQGLIPMPTTKNNKKLWCWVAENDKKVSPVRKESPTPENIPKPAKRAPMAKLDAVEIALGRTTLVIERDQFNTVVVGLNEITGRIRITIET